MGLSGVAELRRAFSAGALALALGAPATLSAEEPAAAGPPPEKGAANYVVPALEVGGFVLGLNQFNRHFVDRETYGTDAHTFSRNLTGPQVIDKDPFSVNQLGHPYQGSVYFGFARSTGLSYWEALPYTLAGSFLWETYGETTPSSINDHVASGIGGTFVGEALFRMASLLLEGGGETPGFWRELGAAVLSPPTGFNRLVFGDRFDAVFPSRDPVIYGRLRLGATLTTSVRNAGLTHDVKREEGSLDFSLTYGVPGKPGYRYTRPFDYFHVEFTAVPNASTVANGIENALVRGLLVGERYEVGDEARGVWGLFGGYDYLSPQIFRVSTTNVAFGTVAQWWLSRGVAVQGTALGGVGFGAAGTVADKDERDYHWGVIPLTSLGLRVILGDRALLEAAGRQYYVAGEGSGAGVSTSHFGQEIILRGSVGVTVRLYGRHALGLQYLVSTRDADLPGAGHRHQSVQTVSLAYQYLFDTRFGVVEWRPGQAGER